MIDSSKNPIRKNVETVEYDRADQIAGERSGMPSLFTCPECSGTLWQVDEPEMLLFRCHVGHVIAGEKLFNQQTEFAENSLWYSIRTLTDKMVLGQQLAADARTRGNEDAAVMFEAQAHQAEQKARALRNIVEATG